MPTALKDYLGLFLVLLLALIPAIVGGVLTCYVGFAWAVLICGALGALCGRFMPTGHYGEGSFVVVWIWILLAIGIFLGLVIRVLT